MFGRFLGGKKADDRTESDLSNFGMGWEEEKIVVELQPQIFAADGRAAGAEALSRYKETDDSLLSPMMFVPLLESASIVSQLDLVVVKKVAEMLASWDAAGGNAVPVAINLSRIDFAEESFMDRVGSAFNENGIDPGRITFEIHESSLVDGYETMQKRLDEVSEKGYHIAIDDFGSNGHLLLLPFDLPVDTVKFDINYLRAAVKSTGGRAMVGGLIEGFDRAGIRMICESVETEEDKDLAASLGIPVIQGFFYDRALSISAFEKKYLQ